MDQDNTIGRDPVDHVKPALNGLLRGRYANPYLTFILFEISRAMTKA
jgi:hypothetical protein